MPGTRKIVQLYRNRELIEPSNNNSALENAKLSVENLTPVDGEIVLIRYKEDDSDIVKSLVAVYHAEIDNEDSGWTFLTIDDYYNKEEIDETEHVIAAALTQLDGDITTLSEVVENNTQGLSDLSDRINAITESDPVFTESPAAAITSSDITNWNGKTSNVGTVTGIIMNGVSKGTSGVVDLGTVLTSHQDISGKADKTDTVSDVSYELRTNRINKTINGTTSTVVTLHSVATTGNYNQLNNRPTIPSSTSELTNDSNFVEDANYVHTDNNYTTAEKTKLANLDGRQITVIQIFDPNGTPSFEDVNGNALSESQVINILEDETKEPVLLYFSGNAYKFLPLASSQIATEEGEMSYYYFSGFQSSSTSIFLISEIELGYGYGETSDLYIGYSTTSFSHAVTGQGYSTQDNTSASTSVTANIGNYRANAGGIVVIHFNYDVPANATLNIARKGAKQIYFRNSRITADVIKAGDTATFMLQNNHYYLISNDRWGVQQ